MKRILNAILGLTIAFASLTSCFKVMGDKASYDAQFAVDAPKVTLDITDIKFNKATATFGVYDSVDLAHQTGIMFSETEDFAEYETIISDAAGKPVLISGLLPLSTYFVRAFVYGKGGQVAYSDIKKFTTADSPAFPLAGNYTATDYKLNTSTYTFAQDGDSYDVFITVSGNDVEIFNLWGGEEIITGTYDTATHIIAVPTFQLILLHPTYGEVVAAALKADLSDYDDYVYFEFAPKGGTIETSMYQALVPALGAGFGIYATEMIHEELPEE